MLACLAKAGTASWAFTERQENPWLQGKGQRWCWWKAQRGASLGQVNPWAHAGRVKKWVRKWGTCSCKLWHRYTERLCDSQDKLPTSGKGFWTSSFCLSPAQSFFGSAVEWRWGNAGHYSHQGLHIVLSLVSSTGEGLHAVCCTQCVLCEHLNYPVTQVWSFGAGCAGDTTLESWTGPWSLGQLGVTDFLPGRGEEMEKWRQKQCCCHLKITGFTD